MCAIALVLLSLSFKPAGSAEPALGNPERVERWIADLEFFEQELPERHIDLFFNLPESEFHAKVDTIKAGIAGLHDYEILVALMKILAAVGDSHTMLNADNTGIFHRLPVSLRWYSDGLYVVRTIPDYRHILGKRLIGIEGNHIEEVSRRVRDVIAFDNQSHLKLRGPGSIVIPEVLVALGLAASADSVHMEVEGVGSIVLPALEVNADLDWISLLDELDCPKPLYLQHADSIYWYRYIEDSRTVYAAYRACVEMDGRPFADFAREILDFIDAHEVDKLAIDLRFNGGGNSAIAKPLIAGIGQRDKVNQDGRLFVIIGRRTYSSALLNSLEFRDRTKAIFVGEETGGKPDHFGETRFFMLPGTSAIVTYSTKHFTGSSPDTPSLRPDIPTDMSFSDYAACRDPALEAILDYE